MGRKLPKSPAGYRRDNIPNSKFPDCIGRFPECVNYTPEMNIELRLECKSCPFKK